VILIGDILAESKDFIKELREMGLNVAVDHTNRKIDQKIKAALKKDVGYALFVGASEVASGRYMLKNLKTQKEQKLSLQRIVSTVKDFRQ